MVDRPKAAISSEIFISSVSFPGVEQEDGKPIVISNSASSPESKRPRDKSISSSEADRSSSKVFAVFSNEGCGNFAMFLILLKKCSLFKFFDSISCVLCQSERFEERFLIIFSRNLCIFGWVSLVSVLLTCSQNLLEADKFY